MHLAHQGLCHIKVTIPIRHLVERPQKSEVELQGRSSPWAVAHLHLLWERDPDQATCA